MNSSKNNKKIDFITIVVAPSGAGKGYLLNNIKNSGYVNAVSVTTRGIRKNEKDGVDYHYIDDDKFNYLDYSGKLIEMVEFGGNKYGLEEIEIKKILDQKKKPYIVVEPTGLKEIIEWSIYHTDKKFSKLDINIVFLNIERDIRWNNIFNDLINQNIEEKEASKLTDGRINRGGDDIAERFKTTMMKIYEEYGDDFSKEEQVTVLEINSMEETDLIADKMNHYDFNQVIEFVEEKRSGQTYMFEMN